jgi:hypothetical protein
LRYLIDLVGFDRLTLGSDPDRSAASMPCYRRRKAQAYSAAR